MFSFEIFRALDELVWLEDSNWEIAVWSGYCATTIGISFEV